MPYNPRIKADALTVLYNVTPAEHTALRNAGAADASYWNAPPEADKPFYSRFKSEVKNYYRAEQGRRCCYCSFELADDHGTFDAEHVLDKSTHPHLMFELNNLAVACKPCNRAKNAKTSLNDGIQAVNVPTQSTDYRIVHPHLDEWTHFLEFDDLDRIKPIPGDPKGENTIEMCGINVLNAARLSDNFSSGRGRAEEHLRKFYEYKRETKKQEHLDFLRALATERNLSHAVAIVDRLEQEMTEDVEVRRQARRRLRA